MWPEWHLELGLTGNPYASRLCRGCSLVMPTVAISRRYTEGSVITPHLSDQHALYSYLRGVMVHGGHVAVCRV